MGFNVRYLPDDPSVLDEKLKREGSKYFYEMYYKRVECWHAFNPDSMKWIEKFAKKYYESEDTEFFSIED